MKLFLSLLYFLSIIQPGLTTRTENTGYSPCKINPTKDKPLQVLKCAENFTLNQLNIAPGLLIVTDFYYSESIKIYHVYFESTKPYYYGGGHVNLNLNKYGEVVYFDNSFGLNLGISTGKIYTKGLYWNTTLIGNSEKSTKHKYQRFKLKPKAAYNIFELGNLERNNEQLWDFNPDYNSYKRTIIKEPSPSLASPLGWHNPNKERNPFLDGNNVVARYQSNNYLETTVRGTNKFKFDFQLDESAKSSMVNLNVAMTNAFYYCNLLHDVLYQFGFNEVAGNFQQTNFNMGGKQGDPLELIFINTGNQKIQSNYSHKTDGESSIIYVNFQTHKSRITGLDDSIIIHEFTHGVASRLLGGPSSYCSPIINFFGLGEGWADAISILFRIPKNAKKNSTMNICSYVYQKGCYSPCYSTNLELNYLTYENLSGGINKHRDGFIYASAIYDIFWNLKSRLPNTFYNWHNTKIPIKKHPNTLLIQWIVDSLKLLPCNPTYINARDAILEAEKLYTGGNYQCEIWCGFAKRGLGRYATSEIPYTNSFDTPSQCRCQKFG